jgi:HAE1 family hydrophobic/amphiphilic exporter-1
LATFEKKGFQLTIRPEKDGPPVGKDLNVRVVGTDEKSVQGLAKSIMAFLQQDDKIASELLDLGDDLGHPSRIFRFRILPEKAAEYGITNLHVASMTAASINGQKVGEFRLPDEDVDLKVKLDPAKLKEPSQVLDVSVLELPIGSIRLSDLSQCEAYVEPGYLNRYQGERAITLTANIRGASSLSAPAVVQLVKAHYQKVQELYPGATLNFAGEFESTYRSYVSLMHAFGFSVMLIYLILATQFRSYLQPFIILSTVMFAMIGVAFGKFFSQSLFTVNSLVAVVGLTGVVVNDSLVLIDFINYEYRSGLSRREAILKATHIRLRPIFLTTITTSLGLLPMALGIPEYSIVWGTMATTFVTGLCTATALTILVVPVQWDLLEEMKERWKQKRVQVFEETELKSADSQVQVGSNRRIDELNKQVKNLVGQYQKIKEIGLELARGAGNFEEPIFDIENKGILNEKDLKLLLEGLDKDDLTGDKSEEVESIDELQEDAVDVPEVAASSETLERSGGEIVDFVMVREKSRDKSEGKKKKNLYGKLFRKSPKDKKR